MTPRHTTIACSPDETADVWLSEHDNVPADVRPTYVYRHHTAAEVLDRQRKYDAASALTTDEERIPAFAAALAVGLVGWRNFTYPDTGKPIPFDVANIPATLSCLEMGAMFRAGTTATRLSEVQKKTSEYASRFGLEFSAASADGKAVA